MRREYSEVPHRMLPGRRDQRSESPDQFDPTENEDGGAVGPGTLHLEGIASVVALHQPPLRQWGTQQVSAQTLPVEAVIRSHPHRRVQVESRCMPCPSFGRSCGCRASERHHAGSGGTKGQSPGHGGTGQLAHKRIHRILVHIRIRPDAAPTQEIHDLLADLGGQLVEFLSGWLRQRPEHRAAFDIQDVDPIGSQGVQVHVEVQSRAEPLDHHQQAGVGQLHGLQLEELLGLAPQEAKDHPRKDPGDVAADDGVVRHEIAQGPREAQHPLAVRDQGWQDLVAEVRGTVLHPPSPAARTETPALAGEGHQPVVAALRAVDAGEAVVQDATAQESLEFALDEPGHVAVEVLAARQKPWQVLGQAHVEDHVLGFPALVGGKAGHAAMFVFFSSLTSFPGILFKADLSAARALATLDFQVISHIRPIPPVRSQPGCPRSSRASIPPGSPRPGRGTAGARRGTRRG